MTIVVALFCAGILLRPRRSRTETVPLRLVLIVLLVEIGSGRSVLAALQAAAARLPDHRDLPMAARLAAVAGLSTAVAASPKELRPMLGQLARAQRSGASLTHTVRRLIEDDLAGERTARLARARSLPTRLMVPVTLLMLPGLVLLLYAPSLIAVFEELVGGLP